jgi:outer membrane protein W
MMVLLLLSCATGAFSQEPAKRWTTRLFGTWVLVPTESETIERPADSSPPPGPGVVESVTLDMGDGWGLGLGIEYRVTGHLFGLELGAMAMRLDSQVTWNTDQGPVTDADPLGAIIPITLAANFHLLNPGSAGDFYVAALVSWTWYTDATSRFMESDELTFDSDFGIGFDLGLNYTVAKSPVLITGFVRYLAPQTEARVTFEGSGEAVSKVFQFSPLTLNLGLGYRF